MAVLYFTTIPDQKKTSIYTTYLLSLKNLFRKTSICTGYLVKWRQINSLFHLRAVHILTISAIATDFMLELGILKSSGKCMWGNWCIFSLTMGQTPVYRPVGTPQSLIIQYICLDISSYHLMHWGSDIKTVIVQCTWMKKLMYTFRFWSDK